MMVFFRKEIESKNLIDWNWFPKKEYKVITKFLNYRHLATLTFDELIQLIDDLKIYRSTFPDDNFNGGKEIHSWRYPKTMLRECIFWLGLSIDQYYEDYVYLIQDEVVIEKKNARFCKDLDCEWPDRPLNSEELEFHNVELSGIKGIDRECGN